MGAHNNKGGVVVLPCNCKNEAQDEIYGKGLRLHNIAEGDGKAYCTVCQSPRRRYNNNGADISPSPVFGHGLIPGMPIRRGKEIANR